jgi:hypothetical protein
MRKRTGIGLVLGGILGGLLAASIFVTAMPAPAAEVTRVPVPTFTPTPGGSQGEYAQQATHFQQALAQAMTEVGELLATPKINDAAWGTQVAEAMDRVESAYAQLVRLQPTENWRAFHNEMTEGAAECSAAMRVLDLALEEQDRNAVGIVGALLQRCQTHLAIAQQLVDSLETSTKTLP